MTIIIASLFLPYTVQFEIGPQPEYEDDKQPTTNTSTNTNTTTNTNTYTNTNTNTKPIINISNTAPISIASQSSLLPTLSRANSYTQSHSHQHTPISSSPRTQLEVIPSSTKLSENAEDFFYGTRNKLKRASSDQLTENLNEKLQPHYIQPKSRYSNIKVPSSIIDPKKDNDDIGLPSLKINRSSSNLSAMSGSPAGVSTPGSLRARASINRQLYGLTLHSNNSAGSIIITEEYDDPKRDWEEKDFNDMIYGRSETKLAPFGGFSNPDVAGFFNQNNIFESAPWNIQFADKGNISLTKAIKLSQETGDIDKVTWIGTISMPSDEVPKQVIENIADSLSKDYHCEAVFPNDITFQGHYKSFCKQILWPTFHYQIPDNPKSKAFEDHSWGHYKLLNQLVADKIVQVYQRENINLDPNDPENMIWIHDYHLLLVPLMVREKLPDAKIGLFLHISFPSSEVFRCFAQRLEILQGMLGANCISFQTEEYVRHFLQTCNRLLLADTNEYGISYEGNLTMVNTTPVGIDAHSLSKIVQSDEVTEWRQLIRERWGNQHLIVSRDKLDRLRGIKQKLLAYETFLVNNPEYIDTTVLIEVCIGSAHDPDYESEITQIVSRINSLPDNISVSQPVVLLQRDIEFEQYVALLCEADLFIVSSMREGLNLTCHEFITATNEKKSPLVLSEFTGSAQLLYCRGNGALLINPWDSKKFSEIFKQSLTMSPKEKLTRWKNCYDFVVTNDSNHWVSYCLESINEAWERDQKKNSNTLAPFSNTLFKLFYKHGLKGKRLFFINFETPFELSKVGGLNSASAGKHSYSEPLRVSKLLSNLLEDPHNFVYIISFQRRRDLDNIYGRFPNMGIIAENGGYIKLIGSNKWIPTFNESELKTWLPQVVQLVQTKVERLPGSFATIGDSTIIFHAGKSFLEDYERSIDAMGDFIQHVNEVFENTGQEGVHATLVRDSVVVQETQLSLRALKFIISYYNQNKSPDEFEDVLQEYRSKIQVYSPGTEPTSPIQSRVGLDNLPQLISPGDKREHHGVGSIFFSGGCTPVDEPIYEYVNLLKESGKIDNVATVTALGVDSDIRTAANYSVRGKNQLLGILSLTS
ncbi:regulatory subunit of alpha,alpha-trehalose-phosphate synthase [Scheffersomyces amazonensis]|uniref:regulatory subunit of alpha,alpha-trehalose-phosphate synthase n=1 Tax=Scheffersomyces amazonensis TaxID=1078765 RepID=UPI00315DB0CA